MAVALKSKNFSTALELAQWVSDAANGVTSVIEILKDDTSGGYVLFYTL